jgi:glycosyltransferase involved in cell wall biosynthesis
MIDTLLTIVIPCKNSVRNLKKTVEDITKKTKVKGTRVLILDFGSVDGSYQYAAQASNDFVRFLKIESIKMGEDQTIKNAFDLINTPYVLVMTPGSTFKDHDMLISSINEMSKIAYPIAYLRREDFIKNIMSTFIKNRRKVDAVFGQTPVLNILDYKYEDQNPDILFDNLSKGIKVGGFTD